MASERSSAGKTAKGRTRFGIFIKASLTSVKILMKPGLYIFAACLLLTATCYSQKTISGFQAPESVIKYGDRLFVSNIGGVKPDPMALDSNGFISELSTDGSVLHQKFQKGILNGPKGMAV